MTICRTCNDTHRMLLTSGGPEDHWVPCTLCPTPYAACRSFPQGAYCEKTPCHCSCHGAVITQEVRDRLAAEVERRTNGPNRVFASLLRILEMVEVEVIVVMQMYADERVAKERAAVLKQVATALMESWGMSDADRAIRFFNLDRDIRIGRHRE